MSQFLTDDNIKEYSSMGTAERKEREKRRRENQILDAAEEVFAQKGFDNATIDDIAEKAELSKGTIYLYFKSKEVLYTGLSLRATMILYDRFVEAVKPNQNGYDNTQAIGQAYFTYCMEFPNYFKIMNYVDNIDMCKWHDLEEPMVRKANEIGEKLMNLFISTVASGVQDGSIRKDVDPVMTSMLLWAGSNGVIQFMKNQCAHLKEHGMDISKLHEHYRDMIKCSLTPLKEQ